MHIFFSTIGDDGSRQYPSDAASFVRVFWNSLPKTLCVENFSNSTHFDIEIQKAAARTPATEAYWRLPSSPIVEKNILKMTAAVIKHDVNHLLIKNNGNATARQKPLKIFRTDKKQWENQKTRERIAATEQYWRLPSSPIVEKNMWFPYVNSNSREKCIECIIRLSDINVRHKCHI